MNNDISDSDPELPVAILYHGPWCPDGFGAAAVAYHFFSQMEIPVIFFQIEPNRIMDDLRKVMELPSETQVRCFDIGFTREAFEMLRSRFDDFLVIDHHKTTYEELVLPDDVPDDLEGLIFDNEKSGCVLAWNYYFPDQEIPLLLRYLQARDIFAWPEELKDEQEREAAMAKLPSAREVSLALHEVCPVRYFDAKKRIPNFEQWLAFMFSEDWLPALIVQGQMLINHQAKVIEDLVDNSNIVYFDNHLVAICNSSVEVSDLGNVLARTKDCDYAMIYRIKNTYDVGPMVYFSLRSVGDFDVSAIAKKYGGGGHLNASSFSCKFREFQFEVDEIFINKLEIRET